MSKKASPVKNSKEELERKKRLAYTLYVDNGFEQKVIADITGISERSISKWKQENDWEGDKQEARMGFEKQRKRIRKQIDTLLTKIEEREEPDNVPTSSEGDVINKLADAAKKLQTELSFAHKAEAGKQFIQYVQEVHGQEKAIDAVTLWHEYMMATA
jgi:transposase